MCKKTKKLQDFRANKFTLCRKPKKKTQNASQYSTFQQNQNLAIHEELTNPTASFLAKTIKKLHNNRNSYLENTVTKTKRERERDKELLTLLNHGSWRISVPRL
jgi:DNA uptake protein ComE-like DNA-binding protein